MNSKDIRNLQEAYNGVYDGDLKEEQEFKSWVTELLDEGYDLSDYTWDEMYDIYNEERAPGVKEYPGGASYSLRKRVRKSDAVKPAGKKPEGETSGYGQPKDGKDPLNTPAKDERNFANALAPKPKAFPRIFGKLDPDNTRNSEITSKMGKPKPEAPKRKTINASYEPDLYDIILSHLIDEGYADTVENAESIMVNMSEDWRDSIFEGMKSLPVGKMKKKEMELMDKTDKAYPGAMKTPMNSPERNAALRTSERASNISDVRRSVSTRGGKMKFPMPEVGRFKSKDD